jgi:hypothetical protein
MCHHNGRLDESLCWACCSGQSSAIDWNVMVSIVDASEIKSQWQAHFMQIFPVNMDNLPQNHESDKECFEKNWRGPEQITFEQFIEMYYGH